MSRNILIITDSEFLLSQFKIVLHDLNLDKEEKYKFDFAFSSNNLQLKEKYDEESWIRAIWVTDAVEELIQQYDLLISLNCRQIFPKELVRSVKCINIHPGLNPYNRGWYPQVFSIINSLPCGVTIHEIDELIDHGPIICQREVKIEAWDTSLTVFEKLLAAEVDLLRECIEDILTDNYSTFIPPSGNLNTKKDFDNLCKIDLEQVGTLRQHIDLLRALSHGSFTNAFFYDNEGNKIYVKVELTKA